MEPEIQACCGWYSTPLMLIVGGREFRVFDGVKNDGYIVFDYHNQPHLFHLVITVIKTGI